MQLQDSFLGNTIEIHYWFNDESHSMDAFVLNKCEQEFLGVASEIAKLLDIEIKIETEALKEGGIRSLFKLLADNKDTICINLIIGVLVNVFSSPFTTAIQGLMEDSEIKELRIEREKKQLSLDILKIDAETERVKEEAAENAIKKKRSNFYENLSRCDKIEKISFSVTDDTRRNPVMSKDVLRNDFPKYIMTSDELEDEIDESADIEIITAVLKKGNYKWFGIYKGMTIPFMLKSNEFNTLVQTGQVVFKNGSTINCKLLTKRKIGSDGNVKLKGYEVVLVNSYYENDKPVETPEGRRNRQRKESEARQMELFGQEDF